MTLARINIVSFLSLLAACGPIWPFMTSCVISARVGSCHGFNLPLSNTWLVCYSSTSLLDDRDLVPLAFALPLYPCVFGTPPIGGPNRLRASSRRAFHFT